ncbi:Phosphoribosylformylglycinamidine synthase subunit PurL [Botrimarina colliarenosi]|uniref:Phosphoribosylformylglycinamidine synthase subunit PurL n=1 Tax=Botrimarina colliarenosi TaxID=2528001 RepID=A0A5C6ACK3_9BACT|nr:phosphoribosylformylglycinamidine synthase subunit PurL [Botrimarina colliarenosi]TWT95993.1 Phosphoribosylformylglycinamidine synthase subunit PurL [Botrimarina colliarenosi]
MLWEVDVLPAEGRPDRAAERLVDAAAHAGFEGLSVATARGFLVEGDALDAAAAERIANGVFTDSVVEERRVGSVDCDSLSAAPSRVAASAALVQVLPKVGVMDPTAQSAERAIADLGLDGVRVRTLHKYWIAGLDGERLGELGRRLLANDAIEQLVVGPLGIEHLPSGAPYQFELKHVTLAGLDDDALMRLSKTQQLYLQLAEMQTIQKWFADQGREPTDIELETLAQTWSEHCSHKTLAGRIAYRDENGERHFESMLKETIFAATKQLQAQWGAEDWCVSVFKDNAGIVRFDETDNVCFKVETHNHPSALEPYGGANTGLGGVIRDTLGTGLGAKPIASTDVFCFAPPDTADDTLPPGVLAPRRVMRGVVEGVRDYGNRMGIPTVNGAICFDERYLGNPLVFCGNVGLIPHDKSFGQPQPGDLAVSIGGRTGRDGIHGATFSSAELTSESESLSGGAVQIGNAVEEKKVADVLLEARDRGLYTAVTDCGAGGFSSAIGEMGEEIGAEVWLEKAPLKYDGLSYTEIWISEAQERMVVSVPDDRWDELRELCESEGVEATAIARFTPTGNLKLTYHGETVGELPMALLHEGRPPVVREATYTPPAVTPFTAPKKNDFTEDLHKILGSLNVASKEWVIRQYDHEVQAGSVVKPLVGVASDGPGDAAVVRPKLSSHRGLVIGCGINPRYGDLDTYRMAASAIDEAIRNCVAVGADPSRIALLDNFCWGDCERSETLGSLVRAALACHDLSIAFEAPFVSGKDSLNNEFSFFDADGAKQTIAIPPTLLISAMGQIDDVAKSVTMDLKRAGSQLFVVGETHNEMGGSHFALVNELTGGAAPTVNPVVAKATFAAMHTAIHEGLALSCHDLSEGGLAVALAEMAFAGGFGVEADASSTPLTGDYANDYDRMAAALFSESNTRFVCEVADEHADRFAACLEGVPHALIGHTFDEDGLRLKWNGARVVETGLASLKEAWQAPLRMA